MQPSPFTEPTDAQEEIRLLSTDRTDGGRRAGGEESQNLCHDTSGCGADLPKWTSIEGGFRPRARRRHLALDAGPPGRHARGNIGSRFKISFRGSFSIIVGSRVAESVKRPTQVVTRQGRRSQAFHDTRSDEEPLVRPNTGRNVIARVAESTVPATSQELSEVGVCTDTIVDDLERDLTEIQHSMPSVLRVGPPTVAAESDDELDGVVPTVPASDNAVREMLARSATPVVHLADSDSENLSDTATDPTPVGGDWFSSHSCHTTVSSGFATQHYTPDTHDV